jgi:hypothetical protein
VSPVKYELGFYITEDGILHSHRREILKSYTCLHVSILSFCKVTRRRQEARRFHYTAQ